MARLALMLTIPIAPLLFAGAAQAQAPAGSEAATAPESRVEVRGPERMVCRAVSRTATRMRTNRVCRAASQARADGQQTDEERLAEAGQTMEALGQEHSTGCMGGMAGVDDIQGNPAHINPDSF